MSFISLSFVALFFATFFSHLLFGREKRRDIYLFTLLCASLIFYVWHIPQYLLILLTSTCVDYIAGLYLGRPSVALRRRKAALLVSLVINLGLLIFFKYANFFVAETHRLFHFLGLEAELSYLDIILPMGISFYTFQSMSYTIDVYRRRLVPMRSGWKFLLYVSFFPQLVAGPIVRATDFLYQLDRKRSFSLPVFYTGSFLIILGYFLKMVLADNLGIIVNTYWEAAAEPGASSFLAFSVVVFFSFQIFCDFAGYSSIARGLAYLLGFRLPINFNSPYIACSFSEFWTRWHISLSQWFRDYVYIPLGGNRRGEYRTLANLLFVMIIAGLWHGAAWTFVVWGALHGLVLVVERVLGFDRLSDPERSNKLLVFGWFLVVQAVVLWAWIFFRATSVEEAWALTLNIIAIAGTHDVPKDFPFKTGFLLIAPAVMVHLATFFQERFRVLLLGERWLAILAAIMLYAIITCFGVSNDFIYFQF